MRYIVLAMIMVLTCLGLSPAQATTTPSERESLRRLPGVSLVIEDITPNAQADGLSEEAIRTAVELILRSSGIRLLTGPEWQNIPSAPYLYIKVSTWKAKGGEFYAECVTLELAQRVSMVQRPEHVMFAPTYEIGGVGIYGANVLRSLIPDVIEPLVKEFANDFLAVNPR